MMKGMVAASQVVDELKSLLSVPLMGAFKKDLDCLVLLIAVMRAEFQKKRTD